MFLCNYLLSVATKSCRPHVAMVYVQFSSVDLWCFGDHNSFKL